MRESDPKGSSSSAAAIGLVSGAVSRLVASPFDVLKIRSQVATPGAPAARGLAHLVRTIWAREGVPGFYRGNVPALALWSLYSAVQVPVYEALLSRTPSSAATGRNQSWVGTAGANLAAGAGAAAVGTVATFPLDTLRTTIAVQDLAKRPTRVLATTLSAIHATGGWRGLYQGVGPALLQVVPNVGLTFAFRAACSDAFAAAPASAALPPLAQSLLGGFIAGSGAKLAVYPLDTVKRRLQVGAMSGLSEYAGRFAVLPAGTPALTAVRLILSVEGVGALYRGAGVAVLKAGPSMAAYFAVYELLRDWSASR